MREIGLLLWVLLKEGKEYVQEQTGSGAGKVVHAGSSERAGMRAGMMMVGARAVLDRQRSFLRMRKRLVLLNR